MPSTADNNLAVTSDNKKKPRHNAWGFSFEFAGDPEQIRTADLLLDREAC